MLRDVLLFLCFLLASIFLFGLAGTFGISAYAIIYMLQTTYLTNPLRLLVLIGLTILCFIAAVWAARIARSYGDDVFN